MKYEFIRLLILRYVGRLFYYIILNKQGSIVASQNSVNLTKQGIKYDERNK